MAKATALHAIPNNTNTQSNKTFQEAYYTGWTEWLVLMKKSGI